jgi:uncharacterized protein YceH (UPF0502 family)
MLDTLAARSPEPFAIRIGRRPGERDDRWASALGDPSTAGEDLGDDTGEVRLDPALDADGDVAFAGESAPRSSAPDRRGAAPDSDALVARIEELSASLAEVMARLARLERELGVD